MGTLKLLAIILAVNLAIALGFRIIGSIVMFILVKVARRFK
jgi:hypothetical protein